MIPKREPLTKAFTDRAYRIVTERDGECVRCRRGVPNRHHRQGRDAYNTVPSNLILLCGSGTTGCHGWVHAHPADATRVGLIVPSWARPSEFPVRLWRPDSNGVLRKAWALLDDDGKVTFIGPEEARERIIGTYPGVSIYDDRTATA